LGFAVTGTFALTTILFLPVAHLLGGTRRADVAVAAVIALVVGFGSSTALGSAYGVAVTGTFVLNTILFLAVAHLLWRTRRAVVAVAAVVLLTFEVAFFASTLTKVLHGGWVPLVIAAFVFVVMVTWRRGREIVVRKRSEKEGTLGDFVAKVRDADPPITRVPGTGVYLNADARMAPMALRANLEHNHVLHRNVVVMTIAIERVPHVSEPDRLAVDELGDPADGISLLTAHLGYHDDVDIPATLQLADESGLLEREVDLDEASYFVSRSALVRTGAPGLRRWRKRLFLILWHNSASPIEYFRLSEDHTVIMGEQLRI
jgi:KUP system potassium uptake protein